MTAPPGSPPPPIVAAAARLRAGGLVAFPTETVYGLGADAMNPAAVRAVFTLKGRPSNNPLIVHVSDEAMARRVAADWPADAAKLAAAFWPGPLTIVVPKAAGVPDEVSAGGATVAVRCPAHELTLALLREFGGPLVGPSANPSGFISPTTAAHVREAFSEAQVLVLDGGPCRGGIESTVVSLSPARILRPGLVSGAQIAAVLGREVAEGAGDHGGGALPSPGMLDVHYAPRSRAVMMDAGQIAAVKGRVVVLAISAVEAPHRVIRMPADAAAYAARVYAALREADALGPDLIVIERPTGGGPVWRAVLDRLGRATHG